jgi:hypothetical protein
MKQAGTETLSEEILQAILNEIEKGNEVLRNA